MNPKRPASSLLLNQVEHMHKAEKRLPRRYHTEIYVNAIKTEGEAAEYIAKATASIHRAHADAAKARIRAVPKTGRLLEIAASAEGVSDPRATPASKLTKKKATETKRKSTRAKTNSHPKKRP